MTRIKASFIRYADDFVIIYNCDEATDYLLSILSSFLYERGLQLSKEKTKVIHWKIGASFDFLG
jgi:RNA-directed DNA polymerase